MLRIHARHFRARDEWPYVQRCLRCRRKTPTDAFLPLNAAGDRQASFGNLAQSLGESFGKIINPFMVDPRSDEEQSGRYSLGKSSGVKELWAYAVRNKPYAVWRQVVAKLKKDHRFPVRHDALIGCLERPAIGRHVIRVLPNAILPPEIIGATLFGLSTHGIVASFFKPMHGHYIGRASLRTEPPSSSAVPEAKWRVNVDDIEFVPLFIHIFR